MRFEPVLVAAMVMALGGMLVGQEKAPGPAAPEAGAPTQTFGEVKVVPEAAVAAETQPPGAATTESTAEEVMRQLMAERPTSPVIAPSSTARPPQVAPPEGAPTQGAPAGGVEAAPQIIGVAPDQGQPLLYREGEFIVSRRGRMVRVPSGQWVFQFEADSQAAPEAPMLLMPCQLLENMEELARQRGDRLVFVLSGQVFTYHGHNWLLASMMKLDVDRGNLQK